MLACRNGRRDSLTIRARAIDPAAGLEGPAKVTVEDGIVAAVDDRDVARLVSAPPDAVGGAGVTVVLRATSSLP